MIFVTAKGNTGSPRYSRTRTPTLTVMKMENISNEEKF